MPMGQLAGRTICGHSAAGAPAQVASSIILQAAPDGPDGQKAALSVLMHISTRARWIFARTDAIQPVFDQARRKPLACARGNHDIAGLPRAFRTCAVACESPCIGAYFGLARAPAHTKAAASARGVGTSIPSPAGSLRAAGLSFIGLPGLDLRYAALFSALRGLSNAACCCSCAPPRCHSGPCHSHHHHPSPGHPQASISAPLTRRFGRSCLISVFSVCPRVGLLMRLERLLRPPGRPPGRWEQRGHWPQRVRRRRRRIGRQCRRWRPRRRSFGRLRRPSRAAAEQQQQQH